MAHLFNIYFPKHYFLLQKEFSIRFDGKLPLPFNYWISPKGLCYVENVDYNDTLYNKTEIQYWKRQGLQTGLRIISINNDIVLDENESDDDDNDNDDDNVIFLNSNLGKKRKSNLDEILQIVLNTVDVKQIDVTFREELMCQNDNIKPLGLEYIPLDEKINIKNDIICDNKITASSCEINFEHTQCRLNNPNSFWKPLQQNKNLGNIWICFDLKMKQSINKILIQGSLDHSSYITKLWIDYSNDGCSWQCHPMRAIQCKYININKQYKYKTATIDIWPTINAQFIRIRPYEWHNNIALRVELYGMKKEYNEICRTVTLNTVNESDKKTLLNLVRNKSINTKCVQLDCEAIVITALERASITSFGILPVNNNNYICTFTTPNSDVTERAMDELAELGIGREIGVVSTTAISYRNASTSNLPNGYTPGEIKKSNGFYASIKSRMVIKQVVERIISSAAMTFDYICMLLVASLIAVGGLAMNSPVIVVASMLVSPIMGPVLAFTFGITLKDKSMAKLGIKNELLSLIICIVTGFIVGFLWFTIDKEHTSEYPTLEMTSRSNASSLITGAYIAAASGVGVALSVLGEYLSTVIGVAISASLLPPAVNCGMCLALAVSRGGTRFFHESGYSLLLTIENIIIIALVGRLMFWIKNVYVTYDQNTPVWESVISFKQKYSQYICKQHSDQPKIHNGVSFMNDSDSEDSNNNDIKMIENKQDELIIDELNALKSDCVIDDMDVYIEPGTDAAQCIERVKNVLCIDNNINTDSTLKGILMRQASHIDQTNTNRHRPLSDIFQYNNESVDYDDKHYKILIQ